MLTIAMIRLILIALLFSAPAAIASPQDDPLSPLYMPTIDTNPADYPSNIWITDTMQKVRRESGLPGTQHWGTFYGMQNEFVDFQVHIQANSGAISNLSVTAGNFINLRTNTIILASSPNIVVYREAYMNVANQVTATGAAYYNALGYYPDILIPAVDPYYHQTTNAWPFDVASGNNQSAWIDILIPPTAPSGYYLGSVTVKSGSTTLTTMPVVLAVWQWPSAGYMPSTATLRSVTGSGWDDMCVAAYGSYSSCGSYPGAGLNADMGVTLSMVDMNVLMLDHRYSAPQPMYPPYETTFKGLETYYGPLLNGTAANTQTLLFDAKLTSAAYAPKPSLASVQNWMTEFQKKGWLSTIFNYTCDEPPSTCAWSSINTTATALHVASPPMPSLVTTDIASATTNGVLNGIDWMVVNLYLMDPKGGSLQRSAYNTWLAGNCCSGSGPKRQLWSYQSCETSYTCTNGTIGGRGATYPNYDIDGTPAANRAMEWMTYLHGQTGELYYLLTYAWKDGNDPWSNVYFFGGWGDGTLIYPGTTAKIGVKNPIYLPSVRLKHIRDGMQDYEYLNELKAAGKGSFGSTQINSWIVNSYTFETTGTGLLSARMALGRALHQISYPAQILPPTNLTLAVQ